MKKNKNYQDGYKLNREQMELFEWLKNQDLNTDSDTLNFWVRKHPSKRIIEVVKFAKARQKAGQSIRNIGGWIHKFLKEGLAVSNEESKNNRKIAVKFVEETGWDELRIYEKYIRDSNTEDDLSLTIDTAEFVRALEALYHKSQLYKEL